MGTRGYFAFRWRGRYYSCYNCFDSYPDGLGNALTRPIPSDPEAYRQWLEWVRSIFSEIEATVERHVFTTSTARVLGGYMVRLSSLGLEALDGTIPRFMDAFSYNAVTREAGFEEWDYLVDLDREKFVVNGCCFFNLDKIPDNWELLLDEAKARFFGKVGAADVHPSISDGYDDPNLRRLDYDPAPKYAQMAPQIVRPKRSSNLNRKPHFVLCKRLFEVFVQNYNDPSTLVGDMPSESGGFLFRELVFAMMCLASCSLALVRLAPSRRLTCKPGAGFAAVWEKEQEEPEFIASFAKGFHLSGNKPGSSPDAPWYWLAGVLVFTVKDLSTPAHVQDAIVRVVNTGKEHGHAVFNAIVATTRYVVLVRVSHDVVQHTVALQLVKRELRERGLGTEDRYGEHLKYSRAGDDEFMYQADGKYTPFEERPSRVQRQRQLEEEEGQVGDEQESDRGEKNDEEVNGDQVHEGREELGLSADQATEETEGRAAGHDENKDEEDDSLVDFDSDQLETFDAIAHLFEAQTCSHLKPSSTGNHGRFPNEIYRCIISHIDSGTRNACLTVSRAFRDYASDTVNFSDGLSALAVPSGEPRFYHHDAGWLGRLQPKRHSPPRSYYYVEVTAASTQWFPVVGLGDGTASYLHTSSETVGLNRSIGSSASFGQEWDGSEDSEIFARRVYALYNYARSKTGSTQDHKGRPYSRKEHYDEDNNRMNLLMEKIDMADTVDPNKETWWGIVEVFKSETLTAGNLVTLFSAAFFHHHGILGCNAKHSSGNTLFDRRLSSDYPWERIRGVFEGLAKRTLRFKQGARHCERPYCFLFVMPGDGDTAAWASCEREAKNKAREAYLEGEYGLWMQQYEMHETCKDFACIVIFGMKMKIFQLRPTSPLDIKPASQTSVNLDDLRRVKYIRKNDMALWKEIGFDIQELRDRIDWAPLDEFKTTPKGKDGDGISMALDITDVKNRPFVEQAIQWVADLAEKKGEENTEERWHY